LASVTAALQGRYSIRPMYFVTSLRIIASNVGDLASLHALYREKILCSVCWHQESSRAQVSSKKCVIDRIRICRTHLLTVEKVEEIDAKLETPARKMLNRQAQVTGLLVYIISTNCDRTAAFSS
jgi:hypothetical protein